MRNEKKTTPTRDSLRSEAAMRREREHSQRMKKIVPLLIFTAIAVFIARQEIPAFAGWVDRLLDAEAWTAAEACREAAKAATANPGFARLTENGSARKTDEGYFVEDVEYTVLGADGQEREYSFGCNVTHAGKVVSITGGDNAPGE